MSNTRHWHSRLGRRPAPRPDAAQIEQLIEEVHRLRLTLTADLSAAASAIDAAELAVARDIVSADSVEVRRFRGNVRARTRPTVPPQPVRRSRALLALPAIPLIGALAMTGAAAFSGYHHQAAKAASTHTAHNLPTTQPTPGEVRETAATTLHQLERVVHTDSRNGQVVQIANHLHQQISAIITGSPHDAKSIGEAAHLLSIEQRLLAGHRIAGVQKVLHESRQLTHLLNINNLPTTIPTSLPTLLPTHRPSAKPTPTSVTTARPTHAPSPPSNPFPAPTTRTTATSGHHHHHHGSQPPLIGARLLNTNL